MLMVIKIIFESVKNLILMSLESNVVTKPLRLCVCMCLGFLLTLTGVECLIAPFLATVSLQANKVR